MIIVLFLGDGMTGLANHARDSQYSEFGSSVKSVGRSVCSLVEAASQAAYLIGISQPGSKAGTPGLVDQALFSRALSDIHAACNTLCNNKSGRNEVISLTISIKMLQILLLLQETCR